MAEPVQAAIRRLGLRLRVYAPVGELIPGMAYLVRRLLENTSNESFLRQRFAEGEQLDHLLAPPEVRTDRSSAGRSPLERERREPDDKVRTERSSAGRSPLERERREPDDK